MIMRKISLTIALLFSTGCSLSPGMYLDTKSTWVDDSKYVYIESLGRDIKLTSIAETLNFSDKNEYDYKIGVGDQIAVTVWGFPKYFQ